MNTLTRQPLVRTEKTPLTIVGSSANMEMLRDYLRICFQARGGDYPHRLLAKDFAKEDIAAIGGVITALHENGFYPVDVDARGKIVWMTPVKSEVQEIFESGAEYWELQDKTPQECMDIFNKKYSSLIGTDHFAEKVFKDWSQVKPEETT